MDDHHELQLQIPHFIYNTQPLLVPGGGAELLPPSWFATTPGPVFEPPQLQDHTSSSSPFEFPPEPPRTDHHVPRPPPDLSAFLAAAPVPHGLPVYSASGFDLLSILARVATRPFPRINLGPVDLTCSFVVVDVRRFDHPIVYCSPSFCTLTGYPEHEVIGRNCRFLQAPGGNVQKGEPRAFTSQDAVNHLRKSLAADKECQTSIVNYKKDGSAFINLVTVIPIPGGFSVNPDDTEVAYQVGFQVDLSEQPHAILDRLRDGSYLVNYASHSDLASFGLPGHGAQRHSLAAAPLIVAARDRKASSIPPLVLSKELKRILADPAFVRALPITNPPPAATSEDAVPGGQNHPLSLVLLEALPDFIHVVSLKGSFLYVAPSVRRVLGYEADEMVGTSIADYAHPEDVIPLMRELKESSATGSSVASNTAAPAGDATTVPQGSTAMPRSVDLLFRARTKMGRYVWVECRGRLHVEPGKGRKAIILSGRAREMMSLRWRDVRRAGGLARALRVPYVAPAAGSPSAPGAAQEGAPVAPLYRDVEQEVWGMLGGVCKDTVTFMSVGRGMRDVLGWAPEDLLGRGITGVVCDQATQTTLGGFISGFRAYQRQQRLPPAQRGPPLDAGRVRKVRCNLRRKDGAFVDVWLVLYRADADEEQEQECAPGAGVSITPAALVYQIRLADAETVLPGPDTGASPSLHGAAKTGAPPPPFASSLDGAVALPPVSGTSGSAAAAPPSLDMFDELSTARGSSWQYELQQLRITNLRLREELTALEVAEASGAAPVPQQEVPSHQELRPHQHSNPHQQPHPSRAQQQPAQGQQQGQYQAEPVQQSPLEPPLCYTYDLPPPPPPQQLHAYNEIPTTQPLFTSQPQLPLRVHSHPIPDRYPHLDIAYSPPPPALQTPAPLHYDYPPFVHQPQPTPAAPYARPRTELQPRSATPQEWRGAAEVNYGAAPPYSSSLKRSWHDVP